MHSGMCQVVSCHVAPLCQVVSCHVAPLCRCVRLCHVVWCDLVVIAIAFSPSPKIAPARAAMASSGLGLPATAASGQPLPSPAATSGGQPPAPGSTIACLSCAVSFVPRQAGQHVCSASCRVKRKSALLKADRAGIAKVIREVATLEALEEMMRTIKAASKSAAAGDGVSVVATAQTWLAAQPKDVQDWLLWQCVLPAAVFVLS